MKRILFASFVVMLTALSCAKTDSETIAVDAALANTPSIDYANMIVGKWQLSEIGYAVQKSYGENANSSNGCGNGSNSSNSNQEIAWHSALNKETVSFQSNGDFTKESSSDAVCKGTFKIVANYVNITSDCSKSNQPIQNISKSTLIMQGLDGTDLVHLRYEKL
jgi:hypothetical protein